MQTNVRLHIGKNNKQILINKKTVNNLRSFRLSTYPYLTTTWEIVGNTFRYDEPPYDIFRNESYPLRIDIGPDVQQIMVILLSKPLGCMKNMEIDLHSERKDLIRFISYIPMHKDIVDTLVDLGVEVIMPGKVIQ